MNIIYRVMAGISGFLCFVVFFSSPSAFAAECAPFAPAFNHGYRSHNTNFGSLAAPPGCTPGLLAHGNYGSYAYSQAYATGVCQIYRTTYVYSCVTGTSTCSTSQNLGFGGYFWNQALSDPGRSIVGSAFRWDISYCENFNAI